MPIMEVGRICYKTAGREAGRKCVIVDIVDENNVIVTGPKALTGVRRRKVNVNHIEPLNERLDIVKGASDETVLEAIKKAGLEEYMRELVKAARKRSSI